MVQSQNKDRSPNDLLPHTFTENTREIIKTIQNTRNSKLLALLTIPMGPTYVDPDYTAMDNIDGDITNTVSVTGMVNPLIPRLYTISYEVTDRSGSTEHQDRTVTVSPPTDTAQYCDGMTLAELMTGDKYNIINKMFSSESSIQGTGGADLIIAGNNGPSIEGRGGDDCIIGGAGDETLLIGNDMIFGNGGDDTLRGGVGDDTLYGGAGDDDMHGGNGNDQIWGLGGNDMIYGDSGDDMLYAGPGTDTIYGGPGTDTIESSEGDTVHDDEEQ